ncbi:MAG TPA: energy transducer TonB [Sunxiuqinia sp.]|nr:energy transducer TonB [Sunxiuqinia sp.]
MTKLIFILFLLFTFQGFSQNYTDYYFGKDGYQVDSLEQATRVIKKHVLSKRKFELLQYKKYHGSWKKIKQRKEITEKNNQTYIVSTYLNDEFRYSRRVGVVRETENGFLIREYDGKFCRLEAEVSNLFPRVYDGNCTYFSKKHVPRKAFFYKNVAYRLVEQPQMRGIELPGNRADVAARYPLGINKYIRDVIDHADLLKVDLSKLSGTLLLSITIDSNGKTVHPRIIGAEDEAIKVALLKGCVENETPWYPATFRGGKTNYNYLIPINFYREKPQPTVLDLTDEKHRRNRGVAQKPLDKDQVFLVTDKMPEYLGGERQLRNDIASEVKYPVLAQEQGIEGTVYVRFVIDTDGNVRNVELAKSVDPALDHEAMRVVRRLSGWKPAEKDGKLVCVSYTVPISFRLVSRKKRKKSFGQFPLDNLSH